MIISVGCSLRAVRCLFVSLCVARCLLLVVGFELLADCCLFYFVVVC